MVATGASVFLVEDEILIRMLVCDMLAELGHRVAAEAGDLSAAIGLATSADFDLAILDVNLNGARISPVAELVRARDCPIIFATGYGFGGLSEDFRSYAALQKPFQLEVLAKTIGEVWKPPA
jgi:CheY-like chemotaxis protein